MLSLGGVFITGYGDSDSHSNDIGWFSGSNFASWIAADNKYTHPVPESEFIRSMKCGRVYTGDPVELKGEVRFEAENGEQMGTIFAATNPSDKITICFFISRALTDWKLRIITDGQLLSEEILTDGDFKSKYILKSQRTVSFIRAELYNEHGRCIMLTNPIYLVRENEYLGILPSHRLNGGD